MRECRSHNCRSGTNHDDGRDAERGENWHSGTAKVCGSFWDGDWAIFPDLPGILIDPMIMCDGVAACGGCRSHVRSRHTFATCMRLRSKSQTGCTIVEAVEESVTMR